MSEFPVLIAAYIRRKQEEKQKEYAPAAWLDSAAKRASQLTVATHVIKFLHSDAKGTSVYARNASPENAMLSGYLCTDALPHVKGDCVGNAAAMDVAGFLQLEADGTTLLNLMLRDDASPLKPFAESPEQLQAWMDGFKRLFANRALSSHTLAKQVYFPLENGDYHLLAPLYPSSLYQALDERIKADRFGKQAKEARDCKKKGLYSEEGVVDYPRLAVQHYGGTKPQNISYLNGKRGGKSFLLASLPPTWKSVPRPPKGAEGFWKEYGYRVHEILKRFKSYLISIQDNPSTKPIRDEREDYLQELLELLVQTASEIQTFEAGWSRASGLPIREQIWLDLRREDLAEKRCQEDWLEEVGDAFATWLIRKLHHKDLPFIDVDHQHVQSKCITALKAVES